MTTSNNYKLQLLTFSTMIFSERARGFEVFIISPIILLPGDSCCHQCQGHWAVKLRSRGHADKSSPEHEACRRAAVCPVLYIWDKVGNKSGSVDKWRGAAAEIKPGLCWWMRADVWAAAGLSTWPGLQMLSSLVSSFKFPSLVIRECIRGSDLLTHSAPCPFQAGMDKQLFDVYC